MKNSYREFCAIQDRRVRFDALVSCLTCDDLVFDCGANVGDVTAKFVSQGSSVECFEPDPEAFSLLRSRFDSNAQVTVHNVAVGTTEGSAKLYFHRSREKEGGVLLSQGSSIVSDKLNISSSNFIDVKVVDFIKILTDLPEPLAMLKMDIEGSEGEILRSIIQNNLESKFLLCFVETHEKKVPSSAPHMQYVRNELKVRKIGHIFLDWH